VSKAPRPPVQWQREDVERVIASLADVVACRVVPGPDGTIGEIHVLATEGRSARYIAQDVVSALAAEFGLQVEQKAVSVAQIAGEDAVDVVPDRLELIELTYVSRGAEMQAAAEVRYNGFTFRGTASGPASDTIQRRLVPAAVLEAAGQYFSTGRLFELQDVQIVSMAGRDVALVAVAVIARQQYRFLGSAVVGSDERQALAKAILDALNRRLLFVGPADGVGVGVWAGREEPDQEVILEGYAGSGEDTGAGDTDEVEEAVGEGGAAPVPGASAEAVTEVAQAASEGTGSETAAEEAPEEPGS